MKVENTVIVDKFNKDIILPPQTDIVAAEVPVALVYNGISHVVMMATPKDLIHFAIGFSLTEGIIENVSEIYGVDIDCNEKGITLNIELASRRFMLLKERRRSLAGRTGCGICGTEQLNQIYQTIKILPFSNQIKLNDFQYSLPLLKQIQTVGEQTGCTHAAVWLDLKGQFIAGFEDIGRHVALDKLLGFRAKQTQQQGVILVSSRASYEMVQKAAKCGVEFLFAVSAATSLAITTAQQCQLTLVGFFRGDRGVIYSGQQRIIN